MAILSGSSQWSVVSGQFKTYRRGELCSPGIADISSSVERGYEKYYVSIQNLL
jgi:hypothetical protein